MIKQAMLVGLLLNLVSVAQEEPKPVPLPTLDLSGLRDPLPAEFATMVEELKTLASSEETRRDELARAFAVLGENFLAHRLLDAAQAAFKNATLLAPNSVDYAFFLAMTLETKNQSAEAAAAYEKVLALNPKQGFALARLGANRLLLDQHQAARTHFQKALELLPDEAFLYDGLGRAAAAAGDHQGAVDAFSKVLELQPDATSVNYPLGLAWRRLGDRHKARAFLEARGEGQVAYSDPYRQRVAGIVTASSLRVALAMVSNHERYSVTEALDYVTRHFQDRPGLLDYFLDALDEWTYNRRQTQPIELARLQYLVACLMAREGDRKEALLHHEQALKQVPNFTESQLEMGLLLIQTNRLEDALVVYNTILEQQPTNGPALLGRAGLYRISGLVADARVDLEELLRLEPNHVKGHLALADLHMAHAEVGRAEIILKQLLDRAPDDQVRIKGFNKLGLLYHRSGKMAQAVSYYKESLLLDDKQQPVRLNLAGAFAGVGRYNDAIAIYKAHLNHTPDHEMANIGLVASLVLATRYNQALAAAEQAYQRLPEKPEIIHMLARLLVALPDEQQRDGKRALDLVELLMDKRQIFDDLETYAMALAQTGQYKQAINIQRNLLSSLPVNKRYLGSRLRTNLLRYEAEFPCCPKAGPDVLLP